MVKVLGWTLPAALAALVVVAAVGLGSNGPAGITYDTRPPPTEAPVPPQKPTPPPEALRFSGFLTFADPSQEVFGPDPWLWSESCHRLDLQDGPWSTAVLSLVEGTTGGALEDLDLYAYDANGQRLAQADNETSGIGLHHTLELPNDTVTLSVCLAGGARATYDMAVS